MIIGLAQYKFINRNIDYNLSQIKKAMADYSMKADLLCFGETFLQGFDSITGNYEDDKNIAIKVDSEIMNNICKWSKDYKISIAFGYFEKDEDVIYSSYAVISEGKIIHNYKRISPSWKEAFWSSDYYKEGKEIKTFNLNNHEFEIALCGDLWNNGWEKFKTDAILLWPIYVSFDLSQEENNYAIQASNIANKTLMINSISEDLDPVSSGGAFYFENGAITEKLPYNKEDVLLIEI